MREMDNNAHSAFLLYYHLIMVTKYRRKVINDDISARGKEIFEYIAPNYGITLEEVRRWYCDECHQLHDRDINAAKNIREEGRRLLKEKRESA